MKTVQRIDYGTVSNVQETPQGGLRVDAAVTRVGVLTYRDDKGNEWTEFRSPEEVFNADSMKTLAATPVTDGHHGLVTAENWASLAKGHASDSPRRDGDFIATPLVVQDAATVARAKAGELKDVSAGYRCEIDETPGVWRGVRFDKQQRNIKYNHVALLAPGAGRAGTEVALRMDGAAISVADNRADEKVTAMKTVTVLGKTYRCDDDASMAEMSKDVGAAKQKSDADGAANADALAQLQKSLSDALVQVAMLTATLKAAESASAAEESTEGDDAAAPEEVLDNRAARRLVTARILGKTSLKGLRADALRKLVDTALETRTVTLEKLRADGAAVLGKDVDLKGKSPDEIRTAVLAKIAPTVKLDSVDSVTKGLMFDACVAAFAARPASRADGLDEILRVTLDASGGPEDTIEAAQAKANTEAFERGRKPLTGSK